MMRMKAVEPAFQRKFEAGHAIALLPDGNAVNRMLCRRLNIGAVVRIAFNLNAVVVR